MNDQEPVAVVPVVRTLQFGSRVASGCLVVLVSSIVADQPVREPISATNDAVTSQQIRAAVERGLAITRQAGRNWLQNESCFSCHHQTLPMLADVEAAKVGFEADVDAFKAQADHSLEYFQEHIDLMNAGRHLPGGSSTAGFGLWALMLAQHPPDETTDATVRYLLQTQGIARLTPERQGSDPAGDTREQAANEPVRPDGFWLPSCNRPPLTSSRVGTSVLALMTIKHYASEDLRPTMDQATSLAEQWLAQAPLQDTEDHSWRLWGLEQFDGNEATKAAVRSALIVAQRPDGGWGQRPGMPSDAYATGLVLYILRQSGVTQQDPLANRAASWLISTQQEDGSWLVESRVKHKAQPYFDNGDPHGTNQFLSVAATSWATAALVTMCPQKPPQVAPKDPFGAAKP